MKTRYLFGLPFAEISIAGKDIELLIDTGFNGALMLPLSTIKELRLKRAGTTDYILADGNIASTNIYNTQIAWFGKQIKVHIVESPTDFALLGMTLLHNTKTMLEPAARVLSIEPGRLSQ